MSPFSLYEASWAIPDNSDLSDWRCVCHLSLLTMSLTSRYAFLCNTKKIMTNIAKKIKLIIKLDGIPPYGSTSKNKVEFAAFARSPQTFSFLDSLSMVFTGAQLSINSIQTLVNTQITQRHNVSMWSKRWIQKYKKH